MSRRVWGLAGRPPVPGNKRTRVSKAMHAIFIGISAFFKICVEQCMELLPACERNASWKAIKITFFSFSHVVDHYPLNDNCSSIIT